MSFLPFLAPLYLAGIFLISAPIIFHLIRRTPRGRMVFSSLMFLRASPPKITRRRNIDNWLLLLLRAAAVCLLACAFARPFLREASAILGDKKQGRRVSILLDTSASMRRDGLWQQSLERLDKLLKSADENDRMAVTLFDRNSKTIMSFSEWSTLQPSVRREIVRQRMNKITPGWAATHLGEAIVVACSSFDSDRSADELGVGTNQKQIVLISDLQSGSQINALQSLQWPIDIELIIERVVVKDKSNAGLQIVGSDVAADRNSNLRPRVRINNSAESTNEQFVVRWSKPEDSSGVTPVSYEVPDTDVATQIGELKVYVPKGQSRIVRAPKPPAGLSVSRLLLEGDSHEFDNQVFIAPRTIQELTVVYIGNDKADDPNDPQYYIDKAFPETSGRTVKVLSGFSNSPPLSVTTVDMMVIDIALANKEGDAIRRYVMSGGRVVWLLRSADDFGSICHVTGQNDIAASEADIDNYAMLTDIDFSHPIFAAFSDARFSDFTQVHVWNHRSLQLDAMKNCRVLAKFDDGDPAIVEIPLGKGFIWLFATGWHPHDSQLALSTKFVPLMNEMLDFGTGRNQRAVQLFVGDSIPVSKLSGGTAGPKTVKAPNQSSQRLGVTATAYNKTKIPGIYTVTSSNNESRFMINVAPDESKTKPMSLEKLEALGVRLAGKESKELAALNAERERQLLSRELENKQKFWRWLILAVIAILVVETWIAGRIGKSLKHSPQEAVD